MEEIERRRTAALDSLVTAEGYELVKWLQGHVRGLEFMQELVRGMMSEVEEEHGE